MNSLVLWFLSGCDQGLVGYPVPTDTTTGSLSTGAVTGSEKRFATDIRIAKISLYQGVEVVLTEDGEPPTTFQAPVVAGRDALLRVYFDPEPEFQPRRLEVVLTIVNDEDVVLTARERIEGRSTDADLESTIDIDIAGADIGTDSEFVVEVVEVDDDFSGGGDKDDVKWRSLAQGGLQAEDTDELTIALIPIRYNADGSGRLPDTSDAQVQRIHDLVSGMYPASTVTIRVDPAVDWDHPVEPLNDRQWGDLLSAVNSYRDTAEEPPNTYYYAMFNGESTVDAYCRFGCILGMSLLAYTASDPYFRASIGVGFPGDISSETLVHEIGHAHGRDHAPCGTNSFDPGYPYPGASIGAWGYDPVDDTLLDPDRYVDMMSYCTPIWVSDYTYYNLLDRIQRVEDQPRAMRANRQAISLLGDGTSRPSGRMNVTAGSGTPISLDLFDANGHPAGVGTGSYFPYDHVAGGIVALDEDLPVGWTAVAPALP